MKTILNVDRARRERIRSALLVFSALLLFLFGLLLLFAPATARGEHSRRDTGRFRGPMATVDNGTEITRADVSGEGFIWSG